MPAEVLAFRHTCGSFSAIYISFMTKRAKLPTARQVYSQKAKKAQIQCVLLTVIIFQLLLCAGDIEQNPGPDHETESQLQTMFNQQHDKLLALFDHKLNERFQSFSDGVLNKLESICHAIKEQVQALHTRTTKLEEDFAGMVQEERKTLSAISSVEEQLATVTADFEDKLDKLEAHSRRNNLRFFRIPEDDDEDDYACTMSVLDAIGSTVPGRRWNQEDIVSAHRLGRKRNEHRRRPRPVLVQFCRWRDKMDILTKGRERLLNKGIQVAGDLTTRQQNTVKEHRERGIRAYYKGNQLVVAGPLHYRPLSRGTFAEVVRRDAPGSRRGKDNTDLGQEQRRIPQESKSTREDYHPYPRDPAQNASHHYHQGPPSWQETPGLYENYWSNGGEWDYRFSPYSWQYYTSYQDFRDGPHHVNQPCNLENLVSVPGEATDDKQTVTPAKNFCRSSGSTPGQSVPASDCQLNNTRSSQDVAAQVVTGVTTAEEGMTADTRAGGAGVSASTSTPPVFTPETPDTPQETVPTQHGDTLREPDSFTQLPGDSLTLSSDSPYQGAWSTQHGDAEGEAASSTLLPGDSSTSSESKSHGAVLTQPGSTEGEPDGCTRLPRDSLTSSCEESADGDGAHADGSHLLASPGLFQTDGQNEEGAVGVADADLGTVDSEVVTHTTPGNTVPDKPRPSSSSNSRKQKTNAATRSKKGSAEPNVPASSDDALKNKRLSDTERRLRSKSMATTAGERRQLTLSESMSNKSNRNINKQSNNR